MSDDDKSAAPSDPSASDAESATAPASESSESNKETLKEASSVEAPAENTSNEEDSAKPSPDSEKEKQPAVEAPSVDARTEDMKARARETRRRKRVQLMVAIAAALGLFCCGYLIWRSKQPADLPAPPAHADVLDGVPAAPLVLLTVDLKALRASKLGGLLSSRQGPGVLGRVRGVCGFEPVDALDQMALVVPASSDDSDFGLIAVGDIKQDRLVDCAEKVIISRGGKPITTSVGSFRAVRDTSLASGEIAVRQNGPLLVGAGNFLRTMVDTVDGSLPTVRTDRAHAALRAAIADASIAKATVVLSPKQRATIADEVRLSGGRAPEALTSVLAAALGVNVSPEIVQVHAVILVDGDARAKELGEAFDALRRERAGDPYLRSVGVGQLIDRLRIETQSTQVHLHLEVTIAEAQILAHDLGGFGDLPAEDSPEPGAPSPALSAEQPGQ